MFKEYIYVDNDEDEQLQPPRPATPPPAAPLLHGRTSSESTLRYHGHYQCAVWLAVEKMRWLQEYTVRGVSLQHVDGSEPQVTDIGRRNSTYTSTAMNSHRDQLPPPPEVPLLPGVPAATARHITMDTFPLILENIANIFNEIAAWLR